MFDFFLFTNEPIRTLDLIHIGSLELNDVEGNSIETKSLNSQATLLLCTDWSVGRSSVSFIKGEDRGC